MDRPERIWLLQTPSLSAQLWRDALGQACAEREWDFVIHERGYPTPIATPGRPLLVIAWLDQSEELEVTQWVVQLSSPQEASALLKSFWGLDEHDALYETSMRLATAWELVERGASVHWSDDADIEIAGLGRIRRSGDLASVASAAVDHPLSMFERGSAADKRATRWAPDIFLYPDARSGTGPAGSLPLVGRRRLLLNGPNIFLPPGYWNFTAEISIDPPGRTELLVEWGHGYDVVALTAPVEAAGRFELSLAKKWTEVQPADFRISLMIPALEGDFIFHGGVLDLKQG